MLPLSRTFYGEQLENTLLCRYGFRFLLSAHLYDHLLVSGVVFKYKGKMPDRPADSNAVEAEAYLSSSPSADKDISLVLHQLAMVTPEVASRYGTPPADAFTIAPALVQPTNKGSVGLASDNFQDAAVIHGSLFPAVPFGRAVTGQQRDVTD
jgi:hypothetical protein